MERYVFKLDTIKRIFKVIDTETESVLTIAQDINSGDKDSFDDSSSLVEGFPTDEFAKFANDFQDDLSNGIISLELHGNSTLLFEGDNFPDLSGGVYLRECTIAGAIIHNSSLTKVNAPCSNSFRICHSTVENFEWGHGTNVYLSHCYVTDKYSTVSERITMTHNEWFMNERVDGELW